MRKLLSFLLSWGLALLFVALYLYTAPQSMLWNDAPNLLAASITYGINVPPVPLYVFLAHFFTLLPFGSYIFRLQIFSAILSASCLIVLYQIVLWITESFGADLPTKKQKVLPLVSSRDEMIKRSVTFSGVFAFFTLAFSYEFWSQSQNTERFIFVCLVELLVILILILSLSKKRFTIFLFIIAFILGLAIGLDPVILSVFPSVLFVMFLQRKNLSFRILFLLCVTGVFAITLAYLYIPFASSHHPFLNYARPTTFFDILKLMTGQGQNIYDPVTGRINGFTGSVSIFFASSWHFFVHTWLSFTPILLPFVVLGAWYLRKRERNLFWILSLVVITNFVLSGVYHSLNEEAWYILSDAVFAIFAGIGYFWIVGRFHYRMISLFIILLISFVPFFYWLPSLNRHNWRILDDYIHNTYKPIKSPAILFTTIDSVPNPAYYVSDPYNYKAKVIPVADLYLYALPSYRRNLLATTPLQIPSDKTVNLTDNRSYSKYVNDFFALNIKKYKIYISYPALTDTVVIPNIDKKSNFTLDSNRFDLIPSGVVFEVVPKGKYTEPDLQNYAYRFSNDFSHKRPVMLESVYNSNIDTILSTYATSYFTLSEYLLQKKQKSKSLEFAKKAYEVDPHDQNLLNTLGLFFANNDDENRALYFFTLSHKEKPDDPQVIYNMGMASFKLKKLNDAQRFFKESVDKSDNNPRIKEEATNALIYLEQNIGK